MGKPKKPWQVQLHPMMQEVDRRAEAMLANGKEPRKHHLVPRFYLDRWSEDGKIRVAEIDTKHTFTPNPANAARQTDFYRVEEGTFKWGTVIQWEVFLSVLEERVAASMRQLLAHGLQIGDLEAEARMELVWFVALQITRGVNFRRGLQWTYLQDHVIQHEWAGDDALRRRLEEGGFEVTDEKLDVLRDQLEQMKSDPTKLPMLTALKVKHAAESAKGIADFLAARRFVVYRTAPRLVTCDEPVVPLDIDLAADEGCFGIANAPILVMPLAPDAVLAMVHPQFPIRLDPASELSVLDVIDLNRAILGNAFKYGFERPAMQYTTRLPVPPLPPAGERRVVATRADGAEVHQMIPGRRWRNQPGAPVRPVSRWWP